MLKTNTAALQQYSQTFSKKICDNFFTKNTSVSGQQLLQLTPIPQVNLFIMSDLYEKWKTDAETFKSPYFNFESEAVKNALHNFMNIVSQNIAIGREHLEPLLAEATKKTLTLLLTPHNYFNDIFRTQPNFTVDAEMIQGLLKYTKINTFIPQTIATNMGEKTFVYANQAITWLEEIANQEPNRLDPIENWIEQFSSIELLNIDELVKRPTRNIETITVQNNIENKSFFDTLPQSEQVEERPITQSTNQFESKSVNDAAANNEESLNESLKNRGESVAENLQNQPITDIANSIPLHQKFMFIHQLFSGSNSSYDSAITTLERSSNFETAYQTVIYDLAGKYSWDITSETVTDLIEILKRRFG